VRFACLAIIASIFSLASVGLAQAPVTKVPAAAPAAAPAPAASPPASMSAPSTTMTHCRVIPTVTPVGELLRFDFRIELASGMHLNTDAPWTLELKDTGGLNFPQTKLTKAALDTALPGFRMTTTGPKKPLQKKPLQGKLSYVLTAFTCTDTKSQCYRDVLKGEVAWPGL